MIKRLLAICLIFAVGLIFSSCKNSKNDPSNQIIKYNLPSDPVSLDPQIARDFSSCMVIRNIFEGLTKIDCSGDVIPASALRWSSNPEFTSFEFKLRPDACFAGNDKIPLTSHDFMFAIFRALMKKNNSPGVYNLYCIKNAARVHLYDASPDELGVSAPDNYTITFSLECPNEDFPRVLASQITMPCNKAFFESTSGQYGLEAKTTLSNGPFKIRQNYGWDHYKAIHLILNKNYLGTPTPVPAGVSFSIGAGNEDPLAAIQDGSEDAAILPFGPIDNIKLHNVLLLKYENTVWGLSFNCSDTVFANPSMRKSFLQALDRGRLFAGIANSDRLHPTDDVAPSYLQFGGRRFRDSALGHLFTPFSIDARATLKTGLEQLGLDRLPSISILCLDDPDVRTLAGNILQCLNKSLESYLNMTPLSMEILNSKIQSKNYQVAIAPICADSSSALDFFYSMKSKGSKNIFAYESNTFDNAVDSAALPSANDPFVALAAAEKELHQNCVFYPLFLGTRAFACSERLSRLDFDSLSALVDFASAVKQNNV